MGAWISNGAAATLIPGRLAEGHMAGEGHRQSSSSDDGSCVVVSTPLSALQALLAEPGSFSCGKRTLNIIPS